ncbi:MAG: hypothetical protein JW894_14670 [Bacteroidales bacterium]|nr:hypothetical protein [Bacteroidales bacterium]
MGVGLFWGIILIVIGLSIIFKVLFDIHIFRIVVAVVFILIGIKILIGKSSFSSNNDENNVFFIERTERSAPVNNGEYNTIFGRTIYDFRKIDSLPQIKTKVKFNTIFGKTEILLPTHMAVRIKADAVFSAVSLPNGNTVAFGTANYDSEETDSTKQVIIIEANAVFGGLEIRQ